MADPWVLPRALRSLQNPRFRRLVVVLVAVPVALQDLVLNLVQPALDRRFAASDFDVYIRAARDLAHGTDPYLTFFHSHIPDPAFNRGYIYPPLLAWALQPIAGLRGHGLDLAVLVVLQAVLAVALWLLIRTLRMRSPELIVLAVVLSVGWYPVWANVITGQVNHVLLLLTVVWLAGWVEGDRWWSGAAVGVGMAIKLLTAPLLALLAWGRRWRALAAGLVTAAVLWAVSAPWLLPEYFTKVAPAVSGGTGFRENQAPTGLISRLLDPSTFYGLSRPLPLAVKIPAAIVSIAVVLVTLYFLRRPRNDRYGRALEAAAVLAAMPLVLTMQSPSQYVTLLIALFVLLEDGSRRRDLLSMGAVGLTWLLTGPAHTLVLYGIAQGIRDYAILEPAAELTGVVPLLLFWLATLRALRISSAEEPLADARPAGRAAVPAAPAPERAG